MRVRAVLDLQGGVVVRGIAGRRAEYRPIVSGLCVQPDPLLVALALRERFGIRSLYVADLDAIAGTAPALALYAELRTAGFALWVDSGVSSAQQACALGQVVDCVVVGLETLASVAELRSAVSDLGARAIFSLDLQGGVPLRQSDWRCADAWGIACEAVELGVCNLLVLDLARVGGASGVGTEDLCSALATRYPHLHLAAGGGVRDRDDLTRLHRCGVREVLVASALHDGRLSRTDVQDAENYSDARHS